MTNTIEIKLHYFLYTEGIHVMDAQIILTVNSLRNNGKYNKTIHKRA